MATLVEQVLHGLKGELIDQFARPCAVGCARIVAHKQVIILWQYPPDVSQDGQSAKTGIKYTDGCLLDVIASCHCCHVG